MSGLTYWMILWGMLPLFIWHRRAIASVRNVAPVLLLALLPAGWLWGNWRASALHYDDVPGVKLLLVQPNISQDDKWRSENAGAIFEKLVALSTQGEEARSATHIIWPESSVPFLLDESALALARIGEHLRPGQRLIAGAIRRERGGKDEERFFTSILEIDEQGAVVERYDKWRLVPGGEFLPLAWLLEPLGFRKLVSVPESFSAGPGPASFALGTAGRAGLLICYEAIFPAPLFEAQIRPDWLINVTNDGWFGRSVGPYQHLAQVRMRAVEQNTPVARAANTGVSAIIDGAGRYLQRSGLDEQRALSGALPKKGTVTPFARLGHVLAIAVALSVSLAFAVLCRGGSEAP
jgi:apolipoprotein N-acyltransferase